jgi:hypothetical protein
VDAIRSRIKRGSIAHVREGGRVYVLLGDDQGVTSTDQGSDQGGAQYADQHDHEHGGGRDDHRDELLKELRNRVRYLEEESRRKDHLLAAALERIPAIEAPRAEPEGSEPPPTNEGAQEAAQPRSWWRRWLGG